MQYLLAVATLVIQALLLYVLYVVAQDVRALRRHLESWASRAGQSADRRFWLTSYGHEPDKPHTTSHHQPRVSYAIWVWKGQCWELDLASVTIGFTPGPPPSFRGSFQGQRVKGECRPC